MNTDSIPIEVRAETAADQTEIWQVNAAAFGRRDEADLVDALRDGAHLHASSVALLEDRLVAHAALSIGWVGDRRVLVLAPVAVEPGSQSRGFGTAVVRHVLENASDQPVTVLGIPDYYRRFGFEAAEPFGVSGTFQAEPGALQLLRPELWPAGTIAYAAPFFEL